VADGGWAELPMEELVSCTKWEREQMLMAQFTVSSVTKQGSSEGEPEPIVPTGR